MSLKYEPASVPLHISVKYPDPDLNRDVFRSFDSGNTTREISVDPAEMGRCCGRRGCEASTRRLLHEWVILMLVKLPCRDILSDSERKIDFPE